jgi:hypothetical protein
VLAAIMVGLTAVITLDAVRKWWVTLRGPVGLAVPVPVEIKAEDN